MKILQVIPFFSPKFGGSFTAFYNLSIKLAEMGHEITIITSDLNFSKPYSEFNSDITGKIEVKSFKSFNIGFFIFTPYMAEWLNQNLKDYDIIHLHNFRSYQNVVVSKYAKKYDIPYIIQPHGSAKIIGKKNSKKLFDYIWTNNIVKNSKKIISVSKTEEKQLIGLGIAEEKIETIYNGINIGKFNVDCSSKKSDKESQIVFLGRINKFKGIDFLIKSFKEVLKEFNNLKLIIAGPDDGNKKDLIKLIKKLKIDDKVTFMDFVEDVNEVYHSADLLVYPASYEIFGLVPFEAIMCGTPVIVTKNCGCGEIITESNGGYTVDYGDINGLKKAIIFALKNREDSQNKVKNGQKFVLDKLNWKLAGENFENIYETILKK